MLAEGPSEFADEYVPDPAKFRWLRIGVPGHLGEAGSNPDPATVARIKMPPQFVSRINSILTPGATVFVTNEALSAGTSGPARWSMPIRPRKGNRSTDAARTGLRFQNNEAFKPANRMKSGEQVLILTTKGAEELRQHAFQLDAIARAIFCR